MDNEKPNDLGVLLENTMAAGALPLKEDDYVSLDDQEEFRRLDMYAEEDVLDSVFNELTKVLDELEAEDFNRDRVARWLYMQVEKYLIDSGHNVQTGA